MTDIQITATGPVFDGRAADTLQRMATDCQHEGATAAEETWHAFMDATFRTQSPSGYQSHINIVKRGQDLVVNDRGVIYGYWLEGIGSRNSPVTRFPGYFNRRRAVQHIDGHASDLCEPIVTRAVEEMNHG
jgi:hypothetical protein